MKLREIAEKLDAKVINADLDREVTGGYAGDFLSFVMGKAPEDAAWFTVMSNINVAAVALLAGVGAVVLCEGVHAEEGLINRVKNEGINLIETPLDIYSAIVRLGDVR